MLEFNENTIYLVPIQEKPIKIIYEDYPCPKDVAIYCKHSKFSFKDLEAVISCNNYYKDGCKFNSLMYNI